MKKNLYLAMMALIATLPLTLSSCSSDDDDDALSKVTLVGTWELVTFTMYKNGETTVEKGTGVKLVFTDTQVTIYNPKDDPFSTKYSYDADKKMLSIEGVLSCNVEKLTSSSLVLVVGTKESGYYIVLEHK